MERPLVVGLGVTGEAVARQLLRRGAAVTVTDDRPTGGARARAGQLGLHLVEAPSPDELARLVGAADVVLPTPGLPFGHPAIGLALAAGKPVWSELELAARWDHRPVVAVTGTNGKTTVTTLVAAMLTAAGRRVVAAGNNELPLVDALDLDVDAFVVEASSFRLQFTERFRPAVAAWLNLAADHLDWHPTVEHYAAAKARMWAFQGPDDLAVANAEDPAVLAATAGIAARVVTFGLAAGDFRVVGGSLRAPSGEEIAHASALPRRLPHDLANALAASATALGAGATTGACRVALEGFTGLPHRVQLVGEAGGVRWYDDSKATTPDAVLAAATGFDSVVLIAGGRNKGLDLGVLRGLAPRLRGVVAIGEAAADVVAAFAGAAPTAVAASMDEAVARAAELARPGDVVLLSPACASFDWYRSYAQRGDDFARAVGEVAGAAPVGRP